MKTTGLGRAIMAAGAFCIMFYTLLALRGQSTFDVGAGNILFYVGVVTLPLGVILLLMGEVKRRRQYQGGRTRHAPKAAQSAH